MKTLVILSHPNFAASRVNKALSRVAKAAADVEVRHLEGLYGSDIARIDARAEQDARRRSYRVSVPDVLAKRAAYAKSLSRRRFFARTGGLRRA